MQPAALLGQILKSGKVTVFTHDTEEIEIRIADKKIDLNALHKDFIKETLASIRSGKPDQTDKQKGFLKTIRTSISSLRSATSALDSLKDIAEDLRDAGVTVTLSYKGELVATIGAEAKPTFSTIATGTKAIQINSPTKLLEIGI